MFNWDKMSLTQKLIWLKNRSGGKGPGRNELVTVEDNMSSTILAMPSALNRPLKSFTEYGIYGNEGNPSPANPGFLVCTNGRIKVQKTDTADSVEIYGDQPQKITIYGENESVIAVIDNVANLLQTTEAYRDEQNFITGEIIHRVGVKILDGTENVELWIPQGSAARVYLIEIADKAEVQASVNCTHFKFLRDKPAAAPNNSILSFDSKYIGIKTIMVSTAADFKVWLAEQYATDHPVIITYPLAEERTEKVPGREVCLPGGDAYVYWATNGGIGKVKYYKLITE